MDAGIRIGPARLILGAIAGTAIVAGMLLQWRNASEIAGHRTRVVELCAVAVADASDAWPAETVRRDLIGHWDWGRYEMPGGVLADRLPHDGDRFDAIRVTRHDRLPGDGRRCRMAMCVYSIQIDRAAATVSEGRCGGGGVTEAVTPGLNPDLLKSR
ncbi:MAG: hypothetical protein RLO51_10655 [Thalassobaculum sp.]|uniref:hypothetical protein n=1 Tax=Thalassobaculum sp. TaxID=2022740 RepID=UPI0032EF4F76